MTALCASGGTSSPRVGFAVSTSVTVPAIYALFQNMGAGWAAALAAYIGLITYDLSTFCASDPPSMPSFTAADGIALLSYLDPIAHTVAKQKFLDWIGASLWPSMCQCDAGAQPSIPSPPSQPSGWPSIDPTVLPGIGAGPVTVCATRTGGYVWPGGAGHTFPGSPTSWHNDDEIFGAGGVAQPSTPPLSALLSPKNVTSGTIHAAINRRLDFRSEFAGGSVLASYSFTMGAGVTATPLLVTVPRGAKGVDWVAMPQATNTDDGTDDKIEYYCDGAAGPATPACGQCPPDPVLTSLLQQILELVTLTQRQAAPFSAIGGAAHSGLTGQGSISVQGLLGAAIEITALPSGPIGAVDDNPDVLYGAGTVTWSIAGGAQHIDRIDRVLTLSLPSLPGLYTTLYYALSPGVTATITEIRREP